jgi:hypothetical protein
MTGRHCRVVDTHCYSLSCPPGVSRLAERLEARLEAALHYSREPACSHSQSVKSTSGDMPCMRRVSRFRLIQCRSQLYQFRWLHHCLEEVTGWVRQQVLLARLPVATKLSFRLVVRMSEVMSRSQAVETYDEVMTQLASVEFDVIASVWEYVRSKPYAPGYRDKNRYTLQCYTKQKVRLQTAGC